MDLIERLEKYRAWKLHRYEQRFDSGRVVDVIYECSLFDGEKWITRDGYGATPELAFERAEESLKDEHSALAE